MSEQRDRKRIEWRRRLAEAKAVRRLRRNGHLRSFDDVTRNLVLLTPDVPPNEVGAFFGADIGDKGLLCLRQVVAGLISRIETKRELLRLHASENGPMPGVFLLPPYVLKALTARGLEVDAVRSDKEFRRILKARLAAGLRRFLRVLLVGVRRPAVRAKDPCSGAPVLMNMHTHTLPPAERLPAGEQSWDFVSWFRRSSLPQAKQEPLWIHHVQPIHDEDIDLSGLVFTTVPWPYRPSLLALAGFALKGLALIASAAAGLYLNRWWRPLLLLEAIEAAYVRALGRRHLPPGFIFNNTIHRVRPAWTYLAEAYGCDISMVHYSHNFQDDFDLADTDRTLCAPELPLYSWSNIVVWSEEHRNFVQKHMTSDACFQITGPVGFSDSSQAVPLPKNGPTVAIFDLPPIRRVAAMDHRKLSYFQTEENVDKFLRDVLETAEEYDFKPVLKPKYYFGMVKTTQRGSWARKARTYWRLVERYGASLVPYGISAMRVGLATDATISFPFTSTASASHLLDKPAAYYDPTDSLRDFQSLANGAELLSGKEELRRWFRQQAEQVRTRTA